MGKLHKLRRAIKREPEKWRKFGYYGAMFWNGNWEPRNWLSAPFPYQAFVKSVLKEIKKNT